MKIKKRNLFVCLIVAMFSFLLVACKQTVKVENIYFNAPSSDGVVLLVGETYSPEVYFSPLYPTNKGYKIISGNDKIVSSRNNQLTALTPGKTYIKVVADENELIQDAMTIQVVAERTQLATPTIAYSVERQSFVISSSAQDGFVNGYTIDINGESIAIGNVLEYSLVDYNKHLQSSTSTAGISAFDRDLTVKVKATVPNYTSVFTDSNFSEPIKINQASAPKSISVEAGKLKIEKSKATNYKIFAGNNLLDTTNKTTFDLSVVDKSLANTNVTISVYAVGVAGKGFTAYDSLPVKQTVKCLGDVKPDMIGETVFWNAEDNVEIYELYFGTSKTAIATTSNNYFNLKTLGNYETLFAQASANYVLKIKPVLKTSSKNVVLPAEQAGVLTLNRLAEPTIVCANNIVSWDAVANAKNYQVKVVDSKNSVLLDLTTENRTINFADTKFASGEQFKISVVANFAKVDDVYFLPSKTAFLSVEKVAQTSAVIENNILKIDSNIDDEFLVEIFDAESKSIVTKHVSASVAETTEVELLKLGVKFEAGKYDIKLTRLGNGSTKIDSEKIELSFVQLQKIEEIEIANSVVLSQIGNINMQNNAQIKFSIFQGSTKVLDIENNTDLTTLNLAAGDYVAKLFVLGDGSKTISVCDESGEPMICATKNFVVLETPNITTQHLLAQFEINAVSNATAYNVVERGVARQVENLTFEFALGSGETKQFAVQAIGDGVYYINSQLSNLKTFTRLETPELRFDNTNNSLFTNLMTGSNYVLTLNETDISASYNFGDPVLNLVEGVNTFNLVAKAQYDAQVTYIDSYPKQIQANKQSANSAITVVGNKLQIVPDQNFDESLLEVSIITAGSTITFDENNFADVNALLAVKKAGTGYTVDLLDNLFNPILTGLTNGFSVKVRFIANHKAENDNLITTDYSNLVSVNFAMAANFDMTTRDNQNICFKTQPTYSYTDYAFVLNDSYVLLLNDLAEANSENQTIKFDVNYIYNNVQNEILKDVNKLTIITLNNKTTDSNLLLSNIGETIYFAKAESVELTSSKNNDIANANNSRVVSLALAESKYGRSVAIKVYNDVDNEETFSTLLIDANPTETSAINYSFNLDDFGTSLTTNKKVVAFVKTNSSTTMQVNGANQIVYMFDSNASNVLIYDIVENATITTDGTKLCVELPINADGVDIFSQTTDGMVKLNTNLVTTSFDLGANFGTLSIVVKTIASTNGNFTNSSLSEPISLTKLAVPVVGILNGKIALTVDNKTLELFNNTSFDDSLGVDSLNGCVIRVIHAGIEGEKFVYLGQSGVEIEGNTIVVEPEVLLQYGVTNIIKENLTFDIVAKVLTGELYLNSNKISADFYGLFAPTKVNLPAVDDPKNAVVQTISWTDTGLNTLSNGVDALAGYVIKVVDKNGNEYLSSENLAYLKYDEAQGKYLPTRYPQIISSTNFAFPYGYFDETEQIVKFDAGKYIVSVMSVPKNSIENFNLCNSKFSDECHIILLETPILSVVDGCVAWEKVEGATEYILTITDVFDSTIKSTIATSNTKFEFDGLNSYVGNYDITIKAISNLNNVLASETSESLTVHRLPNYDSVLVDDGVLILKANDYFNRANLIFRNSSGVVETLTFANPNYLSNMEALQSSGKTSWKDTNVDSLNAVKSFAIQINESYLLKLSKGVYTLSIKLLGNNLKTFGIVNSAEKQETEIKSFVKLAFDQPKDNAETKTWIRVDERGVFTFDAPEEYTLGGFNYQFNKPVADVDYSFFKNVVIYKIVVKINDISYNLLAVDYYDFEANKTKLNVEDFEMFENSSLYAAVKYKNNDANGQLNNICLCVFKNNQINLNLDSFDFYATEISVENNSVKIATNINASSEKGYYSISLIEGGVFSIDVGLLGSDETDVSVGGEMVKQAFLSSEMYSSKAFIRYTDNTLKSYISYTLSNQESEANELTYINSGDLIFQNKIKYDENNIPLDYPVYMLEIYPIVYYNGSAIQTAPYIYYLYHDETTVDKVIQDNPVENFTSKQLVKVQELTNNDSYLKFEFGKYFEPGNYSIKIRTLAGVGSDNLDSKYLLNSRVPSNGLSFNRISNTNLNVSNGKLQFNLAYVLNDLTKTYVTDYEFVAYQADNADLACKFNINKYSEGVTIANNILTYVLPSKVMAKNVANNTETELNFANGQRFNIKVRAIQTEEKDMGMLNADFVKSASVDKLTTIEKSQGATNVGVKDGVIVWQVADKDNYNGTTIRFELDDGRVVEESISKDRTLKKTINNIEYYYYELSDSEYTCIDGVGKAKITAGEYVLKVLTIGKTDSAQNVEILNSNYSEPFTLHRLNKIQANSVVSNDGVLIWETSEQEHIEKYVVNLIGKNTYTFTTKNTSIDFATTAADNGEKLPVGSYAIEIRALGSDWATAINSNTVGGFTLLSSVDGLTEQDDYISWNAVENAQGYLVTFAWNENGNPTTVSNTVLATEELKCVAPAGLVGNYSITIQAVGVGVGKVFNGQSFVFQGSNERPYPVGEIVFNTNDLSLYIPLNEDFKTNDIVSVSYNIARYSYTASGSILGETVAEKVEIANGNTNYIKTIDGVKYCVYPLAAAGKYTSIAVSIVRKGSLTSKATPYADIDFNYFAYGDGSESNPYGIATVEQLLNIALKADKQFELVSSIDMSGIDFANRLNTYGAIIANTFSGVFDGKNRSLLGLGNVNISNADVAKFEGFALFKNINNATIKNINIAETDNNPTKFVNTFAQKQTNVLKSSLIAMEANNSTLNNVSLSKLTLVFEGNGVLQAATYIGGLVGVANNTSFEGCISNVEVQFSIDFEPNAGGVYIGGLVAYAQNCKVIDSAERTTSVALSVTKTKVIKRFNSIGGVAGYFEGNSVTAEISGVTSTINQEVDIYVDHFGGLVGNAVNTNITNCTVQGNFKHTALETSNIGGIVGQLQGGTVSNCTITLVFNLTIAVNNKVNVGFVAGYVASYNQQIATIENCKINQDFVNKTKFSADDKSVESMGIYGNSSTTNYQPTGCVKI